MHGWVLLFPHKNAKCLSSECVLDETVKRHVRKTSEVRRSPGFEAFKKHVVCRHSRQGTGPPRRLGTEATIPGPGLLQAGCFTTAEQERGKSPTTRGVPLQPRGVQGSKRPCWGESRDSPELGGPPSPLPASAPPPAPAPPSCSSLHPPPSCAATARPGEQRQLLAAFSLGSLVFAGPPCLLPLLDGDTRPVT